MNIGLVIGHTVLGADKGARSPFLGMSESEYWKKVTQQLPWYYNGNTIVVYAHSNDPKLDYYKRQKGTAEAMNKQNFDFVVELHFNSFSKDSANGTECLYFDKSSKGKLIAATFAETTSHIANTKLRGVVPIDGNSARGGRFLTMQKAPAIIYEPFFGSNQNDCAIFEDIDTVKACILTSISKISELKIFEKK